MVFARLGGGTWWERGAATPGAVPSVANELRRVLVSETASLSEAAFCVTDIECWAKTGRLPLLTELSGRCRITRGWGDCYGHLLVATGRADLMIDPMLNPWDAAALLPLLTEAGGHFVDFHGVETIHGGSGISVNRRLLPVVLSTIRGESLESG